MGLPPRQNNAATNSVEMALPRGVEENESANETG